MESKICRAVQQTVQSSQEKVPARLQASLPSRTPLCRLVNRARALLEVAFILGRAPKQQAGHGMLEGPVASVDHRSRMAGN